MKLVNVNVNVNEPIDCHMHTLIKEYFGQIFLHPFESLVFVLEGTIYNEHSSEFKRNTCEETLSTKSRKAQTEETLRW